MNPNVSALRESALGLFRAARDQRQWAVAYHALAAVLHAAESLVDAETCELVEQLSSRSAAARGNESVFKQLAVTAVSAPLRMEADAITHK